MAAIQWKYLSKRCENLFKNSILQATLCSCLNPCSFRIILCFLKDTLWTSRRKNKRILCSICLLMVFCIMLIVGKFLQDEKCQDTDTKHYLAKLCASYLKENIVGNICAELCDSIEFQYVKCLNYKEGKTVIFAYWKETPVILKTKQLKPRTIYGLNENDQINNHNFETTKFVDSLRSTINFAFGFETSLDDKTLILKLWNFYNSFDVNVLFNDNQELSAKQAVINSIWSLIQQDEYLFLQYYNHNQFLPKIYGSCGHIYAMEYAPSTGALEPNILQWSRTQMYTWTERVALANKMLDLIQSAKSDYQEELYFCDVKGSNFGVSSNGIVKPIDVDTVFFESVLLDIFENTKCNVHSDCDFFDCKGRCDDKINMCNKQIFSSNLQAFCKKVFSGTIENMYMGLLHTPPTKFADEINQILTDCRSWLDYDKEKQDEVFTSLRNILNDSVN